MIKHYNCPKCTKELDTMKEEDKYSGYSFSCEVCDEDFFTFEAIIEVRE